MRRLIVAVALGGALLANAPARKHAVKIPAVRRPVSRPAAPLSVADAFLAKNAHARGVLRTASGLQYRILKPGTGTARPTAADVALVDYVGTLTDGTEFDRSRQPTPLPIAGVVPGFGEALKLMRKGASYRVWIKPSLGYGEAGAGPIPPGSVLVFDIDLIDFMPVEQRRQVEHDPGTPPPAP